MDAERWQQVKQILDEALAQPHRDEYLAQACQGDASLRQAVESLLRYESQAEAMTHLPMSSALPASHGAMQGQRIGAYKIEHEIAHGGMGAVYLATRADNQYRSKVAIKIIRRGMDNSFVLQRFRTERQILAALTHPNIARLLDGGTTPEGAPYFVMEYIEGKPIDQYCNDNHLPLATRLKIFRQVCTAVQYAHQHLVVHRDLKPSNILVTDDGVPKLLDFGIAKLLTPDLAATTIDPTAPALRLMTPRYASPEQIRGEAISTASDVYSLGVVLYELLTGQSPYQTAAESVPEFMQAVCEQEPPRPSRKSEGRNQKSEVRSRNAEEQKARLPTTDYRLPTTLLKGDLDNIVLMALRKEPQRRYASAEHLSEDLRRYLEGLPIHARKDTFGYRAQKFVVRNKIGVAAAALILLTLTVAVFGINQQRRRAEQRFTEVRKLANGLLFKYQERLEPLSGATALRAEMVQDALTYLDSLAQESDGDFSLQRELAAAYLKIGTIQGDSYYANLNDQTGLMTSYKKCEQLRAAIAKANPNDLTAQREWAQSVDALAVAAETAGHISQALTYYHQSQQILLPLAAHGNVFQDALADNYNMIGHTLGFPDGSNLGDTAGALENYRKAAEIARALVKAEPDNKAFRWSLINNLRSYGNILAVTGDDENALQQLRESRVHAEIWVKESPDDEIAQRWLAWCYSKTSDVLTLARQPVAALQDLKAALAIYKKLASADTHNARAQGDLADNLNKLGVLQMLTGDSKNAAENYQASIKLYEELLARNPVNALTKFSQALVYRHQSELFVATKRFSEAENSHSKAKILCEELLALDQQNQHSQGELALNFVVRGNILQGKRDSAGALAAYQEAAELLSAHATRDPRNMLWQRSRVEVERLIKESSVPIKKLSEEAKVLESRTAPNHWQTKSQAECSFISGATN